MRFFKKHPGKLRMFWNLLCCRVPGFCGEKMNKPYIEDINFKLLLADIRSGDYTHPGDVEAIELVISNLDVHKSSSILDVGCGLGGTAQYLRQYGPVTGIDFDENCIEYAQKVYKNVPFHHLDAHKLHKSFSSNQFDIFTIFCSFSFFENQELACLEMANIAKNGAQLAIFDYSSQLDNHIHPFNKQLMFEPLKKQTIEKVLGPWQLKEFIDLTDYYVEQYTIIIAEIEDQKDYLIANFGTPAYSDVLTSFTDLIATFDHSGGALVIATLEK